jgi:hypothetical protein
MLKNVIKKATREVFFDILATICAGFWCLGQAWNIQMNSCNERQKNIFYVCWGVDVAAEQETKSSLLADDCYTN